MLDSAEVGDNGKLSDATFSLQVLDLTDYFLRGPNETDFLVNNLLS